MAIKLTETAAKEVTRIMDDQKMEEGTFLRVGVRGGGCSGFRTTLALTKSTTKLPTQLTTCTA